MHTSDGVSPFRKTWSIQNTMITSNIHHATKEAVNMAGRTGLEIADTNPGQRLARTDLHTESKQSLWVWEKGVQRSRAVTEPWCVKCIFIFSVTVCCCSLTPEVQRAVVELFSCPFLPAPFSTLCPVNLYYKQGIHSSHLPFTSTRLQIWKHICCKETK